MSNELQQKIAENNELRSGTGSGTLSRTENSAEVLENKIRELTLTNEQQRREIDDLMSQNDTLSMSFNQRLQDVEGMEDLIGDLEEEIEQLKSKGGGEGAGLRAELSFAKENERSLIQDKAYAQAQTKEAMDALSALEKEFTRSKDKVNELTKELALTKSERDISKINESESLSRMRNENASLMSEAVRTTQLLGTLQEDIVFHKESLTKVQITASELRRAGEQKDQTITKLNDKIAFLQTAIDTINDEKISLTDESVKHVDLLRKIESDYYKKKEELEETRKKFTKQTEELNKVRDERDRYATSANPELLSSLEGSIEENKKDNERLKKRISEMQKSISDEEKVSAALREELRISREETELIRSQCTEVNQRSTELFDELGKLRIQYGKKKEECVNLAKENAALKQGGASNNGGSSDEISKLIDERENLLDTINALEASVEEQDANLSDAAKDVDFLEKKVLKLEHQIEKLTQYRAQNKEINSQLQQLRHENNELVKQVAHFQRTKDLKNTPPPFGNRGMVQSMGVSNRSLMSDFPGAQSVISISPPLQRLGSTDSASGLPSAGLAVTSKKLRITQEKLSEERKERRAAVELLKLVLVELDQTKARGAEPSTDKNALTRLWIEMNGRKTGSHDIGYHDSEAAIGITVSEDDDSAVGLRAKMGKKSGDVEAIEESEVASFAKATEGMEHMLLGWQILKHYPHKPNKSPANGIIYADAFSTTLNIRTDGSESFMGADKERRRRIHFNDVTTIAKGVKEASALQNLVSTIEKQFVTIISQTGNEKAVSVLECKSEVDRNALYNTVVCLVAQTNRLFNPEALQIIQINSASFRRKNASIMGASGSLGMRSLQQENDANGGARNAKKVAHSNKLNHSTMKTLQAMGHFDASGGVEKVLEDEEHDNTRFEDGISDAGKKLEKRSAMSEEADDTFAVDKPTPSFNSSGRGSMSREASVSQNINYGDIYRGASKDLDISSGTTATPTTPTARPSLFAGSSTYNLTSNPLAMAAKDDDDDDGELGPSERPSMSNRNSLTGADKPAARRTSVTMAGLGKTQQPINIKGRRKSVVK